MRRLRQNSRSKRKSVRRSVRRSLKRSSRRSARRSARRSLRRSHSKSRKNFFQKVLNKIPSSDFFYANKWNGEDVQNFLKNDPNQLENLIHYLDEQSVITSDLDLFRSHYSGFYKIVLEYVSENDLLNYAPAIVFKMTYKIRGKDQIAEKAFQNMLLDNEYSDTEIWTCMEKDKYKTNNLTFIQNERSKLTKKARDSFASIKNKIGQRLLMNDIRKGKSLKPIPQPIPKRFEEEKEFPKSRTFSSKTIPGTGFGKRFFEGKRSPEYLKAFHTIKSSKKYLKELQKDLKDAKTFEEVKEVAVEVLNQPPEVISPLSNVAIEAAKVVLDPTPKNINDFKAEVKQQDALNIPPEKEVKEFKQVIQAARKSSDPDDRKVAQIVEQNIQESKKINIDNITFIKETLIPAIDRQNKIVQTKKQGRDADTYNIILLGKSRSGKSTLLELLEKFPDLNYNKEMSLYSQTREPKMHSFSLYFKDKNKTYNFNVFDTPGLEDVQWMGNESMTNQRIIDKVNLSLQQMDTRYKTIVLFCASFELGISKADTDAFELYRKNVIGKYPLAIVITRSENKDNEYKTDIIKQFQQHKTFTNYPVLFSGTIDKEGISNVNNEQLQSVYVRIYNLRKILLEYIINNAR